MGEAYPPTAADWAQSAAQDASQKAQGVERQLNVAVARIASLEERVQTLELNLRVVLDRMADPPNN